MLNTLARSAGSLLIALGCLSGISAEEAAPPTAEELQALVQQLDADDFGKRQEASQALGKLGPAAIPALEQALRSDSTEAATRSFELMERQLKSSHHAAQAAARAALERLATGEGVAARRAQQLLAAPKLPANAAAPAAAPRFPGPRIRLGGRLPIPVQPAPVQRTVKISVQNGVKTIEVDNDGERVKIVDDPAKGIELETTKTKDGREVSEKFTAKDATELKTKHPEAHALYAKYATGQLGNVRVEVGAGGVARDPAALKEALAAVLERLDKQIERTKNDAALPEEFRRRHVETLQQHRDRLKESMERNPLPPAAEEKPAEEKPAPEDAPE
jgi:hypothetical protein